MKGYRPGLSRRRLKILKQRLTQIGESAEFVAKALRAITFIEHIRWPKFSSREIACKTDTTPTTPSNTDEPTKAPGSNQPDP